MKAIFLFVTVFALGLASTRGQQSSGLETHRVDLLGPERFSGHVHGGWDSRYVSEGRDNLGGDGIFSSTLELGVDDFTLAAWYGNSPDSGYQESSLTVLWTHEIDDWEIYAACLWTTFPGSTDDDEYEFAGGFAWSGLPWDVDVGIDAHYLLNTRGTFIDLSASREIDISPAWSLEPTFNLGVNQGYVADGHDGWNHLQLSLASHWSITEHLSLHAMLAWTHPIARDANRHAGDDPLGSFGHAGVWMVWAF